MLYVTILLPSLQYAQSIDGIYEIADQIIYF